ncbi:MAG: hypothetical protein GMKNLPBB_03355 [Myxococcota bacterium]|nr:hypothetical protein [Myxococcota bacterium]
MADKDGLKHAQRADLIISRYGRHFAGHNRATRDLRMLREMLQDLKAAHTDILKAARRGSSAELDRRLGVVKHNLEIFQAEIGEIEQAFAMGSPREQSSAAADRANNQFALYRLHFAGRPRNTRRPALLIRMIGTLEDVLDHMNRLKEPLPDDETLRENIRIVSNSLETYRSEREQIREARRDLSTTQLADFLGGEANQIFEEYGRNYASQDRTTRDPKRLGELADLLGEIEKQMTEIHEKTLSPTNEHNLAIVRDNLTLYEKEYEAILEARKNVN